MTDNKLTTYPDKAMPNLVRIKYEKGGNTPEQLEGLYTGWTMAKKAIDAYEALKVVHQPIAYTHQKTISDEEEATLFKKIEEEVATTNRLLEAKKDGKEEKPEGKDEVGTEHLRTGANNGSKPVNLPGECQSS